MLAKSLEGEISLGGDVLATPTSSSAYLAIFLGVLCCKQQLQFLALLMTGRLYWNNKVFHKTERIETLKSGKSYVNLEGQ